MKTSNDIRAGSMGEMAEVVGPYERAPFGKELIEIASHNEDIVAVTADMGKYSDLLPFRDMYKDRYFNVGMAEQSAIMTGAGLSKVGKIAFVATYSAFLTRRALDFMAIAAAHSDADVKVMGGAPGLVNPYGGTHQAIEDLAVMRSIPGVTVIDPCDATELRQVVRIAAETPGTFYIRNLRGNVPRVFDSKEYEFKLGKAQQVREGSNVGVISTGFMTQRALEAAAEVEDDGLSVGVLHVPSIKPFDTEAVIRFCAKYDRIITAENHLRTGGLGTLVMEALYEGGVPPMKIIRIGLQDRFHPCGSHSYLDEKFGLDVHAIKEAIRSGQWNY